MSNKSQSKNKGRIKVNDLPRKEKELKDREAKEVRGGKLGESQAYPSPANSKPGAQGGDMRL